MHILRFREKRSLANARKNRLEIIKAQLSRRDMIRAGLIGAGGYLVLKNGLSQWASGHAWAQSGPGSGGGGGGGGSGNPVILTSPPTRAFIEATIAPNTAGGEGRTRPHQAFSAYPTKFTFPPALKFETHQRAATRSCLPTCRRSRSGASTDLARADPRRDLRARPPDPQRTRA